MSAPGTGRALAEIPHWRRELTYIQLAGDDLLTRMYGPAVRRKGIQDGEVGLALMYPALAEQNSWPSWISARIRSH